MTLEQEKKTAKFLDSRLDDETAAKVEKWNLAISEHITDDRSEQEE